jgi:hypothetical protein
MGNVTIKSLLQPVVVCHLPRNRLWDSTVHKKDQFWNNPTSPYSSRTDHLLVAKYAQPTGREASGAASEKKTLSNSDSDNKQCGDRFIGGLPLTAG